MRRTLEQKTALLERMTFRDPKVTETQLEKLETLYRPDVEFTDPLNDIKGRDGFMKMMRRWAAMSDSIDTEVTSVETNGNRAVIEWTSDMRLKLLPRVKVLGRSELTFDAAGHIARQHDAWPLPGSARWFRAAMLLNEPIRLLRGLSKCAFQAVSG